MEPYTGCTIVDVDPGVGLFSAKLNELLKPRSHVLLESQPKLYEKFLKPLLSHPANRLQIPDYGKEDDWDMSQYGEASAGAGSTSKSPILLVANVAGKYLSKSSQQFQLSVLHRTLEYTRSVKHDFRSGAEVPIRMLLWMHSAEKHRVLPRTVALRTRLACLVEACCHVEEVAGTASPPENYRREDTLDIEGRQRVAADMLRNGIFNPPHRVADEESATSELAIRDWHRELQKLEEGFKNQKLSQYIGQPPGPVDLRKVGRQKNTVHLLTPEWVRYRYLRSISKTQESEAQKFEVMLQLQHEIDKLDLLTYTDPTGAVEREARLRSMDAKSEEIEKQLSTLTGKQQKRFQLLDDDRRAFRMEPPLLNWDRRTAEPLIAQKDEFSSKTKDICLLDFRPRPDWKSLPVTTVDQDICFERLTSQLRVSRQSVGLRYLDAMHLGAYEALVEHSPYFHDPRNGGRRDLDNVRVRTMPANMFTELAIAWDHWEDKPPISDLIYSTEENIEDNRRKGNGNTRFFV